MEKSAVLGRGKTCAPNGVLRIPVAPDQKPRTKGLEKCSVVSSGRGVERWTVDCRHCQGPWDGFKADGSGL
jgi:hypothetical protein